LISINATEFLWDSVIPQRLIPRKSPIVGWRFATRYLDAAAPYSPQAQNTL
jgi:hypothetical protein